MMKKVLATALSLTVAMGTVTTAFGATTINTMSMFGGTDPNAAGYQTNIKTYEKATGNKVTDSSDTATSTWKASVLTDFNTGNEPDVLQFFTGIDAKTLITSNKFVDYDTIKAKYPDYAKDVNKSALDQMKEIDGKTYAIPTSAYWEGLYVNKTLFDKYKLALPTDWDKLTAAIKAFTAAKITPIAVGFADEPHYTVETLVLAAGGVAEHAANPGSDMSKVPASWVKGLDTFKTLADLGAFGNMKIAATKKNAIATRDVANGKAAMFMSGSWSASNFTFDKTKANFIVMAFPAIPGGKGTGKEVLSGFSSGFYITKKAWDNAEKQKAAVDFVMTQTTKTGIQNIVATQPFVMASVSIPQAPISTAYRASVTTMTATATGTDFPMDSRLVPAAWNVIWTSVGKIASGEMTAQQVLDKAIPLNK